MPQRTPPPHQESLTLPPRARPRPTPPSDLEPPSWVREGDEPASPEAVAAILADLDPEQRAAATHADGPLLVVAGAGTGKTRVIAHRIAWLVAAKRAHPSQILSLTFTERAAAEMEARVDLLVPYGYTDMWISTFHAFGDRIYREYALELGLPDTARVLSEAERVVFFRERLFRLPLRRYLPLGNPVRHLQALVRLTARAKDEGITPERYIEYAQSERRAAAAELGALAEGAPETERDRIRARVGEAERQVELAEVYRAMEEELHGAGRIDFGDQLLLVHRLLRSEPAVLEALRRRFKYILVDEFQDTNTVQFELLKLLAGGHRNLMVVGDDDQSIYRFRGAALSNLLSFSDTFPDRRLVVLTRNYRSGQRILDTAHRLIEFNPDRLEIREKIEKRLRSQSADIGIVELQSYGTAAEEASAVTKEIQAFVGSGGAHRDVAVLVRSNRDAAPFLSAFSAAGIPHDFSGNQGLFGRPEVRLAIAFLRTVARRADSQSLFALAASPVYAVPMTDLVKLSDFARARRRTLHWALKEAVAAGAAAESGESTPALEPLSAEGIAGLTRLAADLARWVELARERSTGEILYQFLADTGILAKLSMAADQGAEEQILNLGRFFTLVSRYAEAGLVDRVGAFVDHLELLIEAGDDPQAAEPDPDRDAVRVLTVHRAKGLEFPVVYMVNLVTQKFPVQERRDAIRLPEALVASLTAPPPSAKSPAAPRNLHLEEERRLFYVGMTRARERLVFTTAADHGGFRPRKPSPFIAEALDLAAGVTQLTPAAAAREAIARHQGPAAAVTAPPARRAATQGIALDLSFSRLETYGECPLRYRFAYILRVPSVPHHSQSYGKSIHDAIEFLLRARMAGENPPLADVEAAFRRAWRSEGYLSREHEERRFEAGLQTLRRFAAAEAASPQRPAQVEKEFLFDFEGDRVSGRFDRIDLTPDGATVIDYKTAAVDEPREAQDRARKSLQLKLYALAYQRQSGRLPLRGELRFVETDLAASVDYTPADLETAERAIRDVAAGIRADDFTARPSPQACGGCAFQRVCPAAVW
jgi:DNA helicase II / ATP-dependent DNA helicase PcrA